MNIEERQPGEKNIECQRNLERDEEVDLDRNNLYEGVCIILEGIENLNGNRSKHLREIENRGILLQTETK